jgi:hypothetical protein
MISLLQNVRLKYCTLFSSLSLSLERSVCTEHLMSFDFFIQTLFGEYYNMKYHIM